MALFMPSEKTRSVALVPDLSDPGGRRNRGWGQLYAKSFSGRRQFV